MNNNDQKAYYHSVNCGMINIIKGQLTNKFSKILKLRFFHF
jgi:hypothetical protein